MGKSRRDKCRHVRWNWERSPDTNEGVRYHFVVVDDKNRDGTLRKILEQMQSFESLQKIREVTGKVSGTRLRYLFCSYDCNVAPREIDLVITGKKIVRDWNLRERLRGNIEDYVADLYGL